MISFSSMGNHIFHLSFFHLSSFNFLVFLPAFQLTIYIPFGWFCREKPSLAVKVPMRIPLAEWTCTVKVSASGVSEPKCRKWVCGLQASAQYSGSMLSIPLSSGLSGPLGTRYHTRFMLLLFRESFVQLTTGVLSAALPPCRVHAKTLVSCSFPRLLK